MNDKKTREPMVIALATGKGGSMKTTSAVFLACASWTSPGASSVCSSPTRTCRATRRTGGTWPRDRRPAAFDVMSAAPADIKHLHGINDRLDDPVDWVLIDSAPYGRALDESVNTRTSWSFPRAPAASTSTRPPA